MDNMIIYELVYKDGMTHSSDNYDLIKQIWYKDKELLSHVEIRDTKTGFRSSHSNGFGKVV